MLLRGMRDKPNITKIALHSKNIARILRRSRVSNSAQDLALQCGALKSIGWQNMAFNAPHALATEEARGPQVVDRAPFFYYERKGGEYFMQV